MLIHTGQPVALVEIVPNGKPVLAGSLFSLNIIARDASSTTLLKIQAAWTSLDPAAAKLDDHATLVNDFLPYITVGPAGTARISANVDGIIQENLFR